MVLDRNGAGVWQGEVRVKIDQGIVEIGGETPDIATGGEEFCIAWLGRHAVIKQGKGFVRHILAEGAPATTVSLGWPCRCAVPRELGDREAGDTWGQREDRGRL
jgi:hypothetical protein